VCAELGDMTNTHARWIPDDLSWDDITVRPNGPSLASRAASLGYPPPVRRYPPPHVGTPR
jgi:hypothetical protein